MPPTIHSLLMMIDALITTLRDRLADVRLVILVAQEQLLLLGED